MNFNLLSLVDLDEAEETLTTIGYLWVTWTDDYLVWNITDYGNISKAFFPQNDVWKPDLTLRNSIDEYKELGDKSLYVAVNPSGFIDWQPFQVNLQSPGSFRGFRDFFSFCIFHFCCYV